MRSDFSLNILSSALVVSNSWYIITDGAPSSPAGMTSQGQYEARGFYNIVCLRWSYIELRKRPKGRNHILYIYGPLHSFVFITQHLLFTIVACMYYSTATPEFRVVFAPLCLLRFLFILYRVDRLETPDFPYAMNT